MGVSKRSRKWYSRVMKKKEINGARRFPKCGKAEKQVKAGKNRCGTQRCYCNDCKKYYTLEAKTRAYSEEVRQEALRIYYSGVSGRGVGKILGINKSNVYNWIKKTPLSTPTSI